MPQEPLKLFKWNRPLTLERLQAVQHRLSTFYWETCCEVDQVQLHAEKRDPLRRGEFALFPVDPKPQPAEVTEHSVPVFPQLCSRLGKYEPVVQVVENANASFFPIYELCYIGAETREEGGTRCQRALAAEGDRGAEEIGQQEVAETASGCPRRWCWSKRRTGGTEGSLPCSWVEEGWLLSERERRSRAEACCRPPCPGRSRERETRCRLPSTGGAIAVRREAEERRAVHQKCPLPSHGTASESISAGWGPSGSVRAGGSRVQSRVYPPACEGRWGYVGRGREPWEQSRPGWVNDNERHLRHSPVSSPTE